MVRLGGASVSPKQPEEEQNAAMSVAGEVSQDPVPCPKCKEPTQQGVLEAYTMPTVGVARRQSAGAQYRYHGQFAPFVGSSHGSRKPYPPPPRLRVNVYRCATHNFLPPPPQPIHKGDLATMAPRAMGRGEV
jgi:hypothetical protein